MYLIVFLALFDFCVIPAQGATLPDGLFALSGTSTSLPEDDLAPFQRVLGKSKIVGLGEEAHGSGGFSQMKVRLIEYMVENLGFRNVGMEVPGFSALPAEKYVESCTGNERSAVLSLLYPQFRDESVGHLLTWLCEFNKHHISDKVHFFGVDEEDEYLYLPFLKKYLTANKLDPDSAIGAGLTKCVGGKSKSLPEWLTILSEIISGKVPVDTAENQSCIMAISQLRSLLWAPSSVTEDYKKARLATVSLSSFQEEMFRWGIGGIQVRDRGMAEILSERLSWESTNEKAIIWAADIHISGAKFGNGANAYKTMGTWLTESYGSDYFSVAFTAYDLLTLCNGSCIPEFPQEKDSLATELHRINQPYLLLNLNSAYLPTGERYSLRGLGTFVPSENYRAAIFLESSHAITPIK